MIHAKRLGHATFATPDVLRELDYYRDVLGLLPVEDEQGRVFLATESGQLAVALEHGDTPACTGVAFEIARSVPLLEVARELNAAGLACELRMDSAPGLSQSVAFTDLKGTTVELFSAWDFVQGQRASEGIRPLRFGHLAFTAPDPSATAGFYERTLGFRVSDWIEDFFVFLRCNLEHHTVNFVRGPSNAVHHIAFELRDASHMHAACDLLGRHRIPIVWGPVRHGPGHNVAVYHRNAAGHLVELFIELDRMVDDDLGYYEPRPWHRDRPQRPKVWTGRPRDIWGLPPLPEFYAAASPNT